MFLKRKGAPARRAATFLTIALVWALGGGTAAAKQILDQPGAFQVALPDDFKVMKHGRGQTTPGSYVLNAQSLAGNVKIFATSMPHGDPSVAFSQKFALWESRARKHRWYDTIKPVTGLVRAKSKIPTFFRSYDAMGARNASKQLYRVLVMMSRHPETRRLYTVAVASQADYFKANEARVRDLAAAFQPLVSTAPKFHPRGSVKKVSLRGRLQKSRTGKVESRLPKAPAPRLVARKDAPRRLTPAQLAARAASMRAWQAKKVAHERLRQQRAAQQKKAQQPKSKGPATKQGPTTKGAKTANGSKGPAAKAAAKAAKDAAKAPTKLAPGVRKDAKGKLVDGKGRSVDELGHRLDAKGKHLEKKEEKHDAKH